MLHNLCKDYFSYAANQMIPFCNRLFTASSYGCLVVTSNWGNMTFHLFSYNFLKIETLQLLKQNYCGKMDFKFSRKCWKGKHKRKQKERGKDLNHTHLRLHREYNHITVFNHLLWQKTRNMWNKSPEGTIQRFTREIKWDK